MTKRRFQAYLDQATLYSSSANRMLKRRDPEGMKVAAIMCMAYSLAAFAMVRS